MGVLLIGYQFGVEFLKVACKAPFFNSFIYEVNYAVDTSSLRLYADDTTQYAARLSHITLASTLNRDVAKSTPWFSVNQLVQVKAAKTKAMNLGKS